MALLLPSEDINISKLKILLANKSSIATNFQKRAAVMVVWIRLYLKTCGPEFEFRLSTIFTI